MTNTLQYIIINDESQNEVRRQLLTRQAMPLQFPLSDADLNKVRELAKAFDSQERIAGLAAPQIGIPFQIIIFHAPLEIKKFRSDLVEPVAKTIWLNPSYIPIGEDTNEDYEACFSVGGVAGIVPRYKKIRYEAFLVDGTKVSGDAEGYIARVIQHEIDHLRGVLFIDRVKKDKHITMDEYLKIRSSKMGHNK